MKRLLLLSGVAGLGTMAAMVWQGLAPVPARLASETSAAAIPMLTLPEVLPSPVAITPEGGGRSGEGEALTQGPEVPSDLQAAPEKPQDVLVQVRSYPRPVWRLPSGPTAPAGNEDVSERLDLLLPRVAHAAEHRLGLLDARYELTAEQRGVIFYAYAYSAAARLGLVDPVVSVSTLNAGDDVGGDVAEADVVIDPVDEAVFDALTPEQQDQFVDEAVDRDLWWTEVVGGLIQDVDEGLDVDIGASGDGVTDPSTLTDDSAHGTQNLFDLFNP